MPSDPFPAATRARLERRYPPEDCNHGQTHCSDCDLPFAEHRYLHDPPSDDVPLTDTRCMDALIREGRRLQGVIDALRAAQARDAPVLAAADAWEERQQYWAALESVRVSEEHLQVAERLARDTEAELMAAVAAWRAARGATPDA